MGNQLNKFILLMWKNWTLLKRRPIHTAFEIIYPVLICCILVSVRSIISADQRDKVEFPPFDAADYSYLSSLNDCNTTAGYRIGYSPNSPFLKDVIINALKSPSTPVGYNNKAELDAAIDNHISFCFVIQFNDELSGALDNKNLPSNLDITIRLPSEIGDSKNEWFTNILYPMSQTPGPREPENGYGGDPGYFDRGFLFLQERITLGLMGYGSIDAPAPDIKMQRFPYPGWLDDRFYGSGMSTMVTMMIMISFMYNYINTIRAITNEKEKQLKESMKIMGLPGWLHWVAWFLRSFIILLLAIILIVIVVKLNVANAAVFTHSDGTVLFIFFLLFACSTITFTFLISVFFTKANTAAAVGSLIFFITYLPYTLQQQQSDELSAGAVLGSSLLANSGLSFGLSLILKFEAIEEGIQWDNLWNTTSPDENVTVGAILLMFLLDTFLYLAIALYIEAVFPGDFGVPQPWYFPVSRDYWCSKPPTLDHEDMSGDKAEFFERFTENLPIGIQIKSLSKTFGANRAVKKLNLDMYEGHITVLLGHNGAGKTTTMSMITGMFPPSKGTAVVNGYDIRTSIQNVRDSMGLCLQHNVLFDGLTVAEHLYFFGKLKGLNNKEVKEEIDNYIKLLELEDKRNAKSSTLSGGMKRKLSVGMALCGKSKIVMLDEPTAGMDPSARRAIWNLLQKQKQGRTILLTTHFMDEADLLGDRIAIMTAGELQCCGSSFFLKRKYGAGYYLIMDVAPQCQPENITNLLRKHIPHVQVQAQAGSELTYQLSESDSNKFEEMLSDLEKHINQLGVRSYGVSLTTLEEVFMKVGADHDNEISKMYNQNNNGNGVFNGAFKVTVETSNEMTTNYLSGFPLITNQFIAMLLKKFFSTLRNWYLLILQIALPVALLIITVLTARGYVPKSTFPSLKISLDPYNEPVTLMAGITNLSYYETYRNNLGNDHQPLEVSDIATEMSRLTSESPANAKRHYIVAASFNESTATAWFNGDPYHSSPLSLSLVLNAFYKQKFDETYSVTFINHPLPLSLDIQLDNLQFNLMGFQISVELGFGMAFVASFYILFYIRERVSKAKHLQFVSGVNVVVFWGTSFLCDMVTYLLTMIAILITFAALQEDGYKTPDELGRITLVLVYFGFFVLPFTYLASYLFSVPSSGFSRMMLLGAVGGTFQQPVKVTSISQFLF
jgi:ATP-binding cassette subfamily A (ABC1) protein 3